MAAWRPTTSDCLVNYQAKHDYAPAMGLIRQTTREFLNKGAVGNVEVIHFPLESNDLAFTIVNSEDKLLGFITEIVDGKTAITDR